MLIDYFFIFIYFLIIIILATILFILSYLFIYRIDDFDKISTYECGFDPFGEARTKIEIRFYLVSILFIIFDLEIAFLFPYVIIIEVLEIFSFILIIFFTLIIVVGFSYEWVKGALEWR